MIVRVKASKDIKRLTDERNAAMQVSDVILKTQISLYSLYNVFEFNFPKLFRIVFFQEYSLIMSERDTFHKEMEKLQDEVAIF